MSHSRGGNINLAMCFYRMNSEQEYTLMVVMKVVNGFLIPLTSPSLGSHSEACVCVCVVSLCVCVVSVCSV